MKLSIIIPIYHTEKTLKACVSSVLSQSFTNYELILVDDGSDDSCPTMCDKFASEDPRFIVIHKENGGLCDARNAGLNKAQGEYVTFIDSDDTIGRHTLQSLMDYLDQHPSIDIIEFPVYEHYGNEQRQHIRTFQPKTYDNALDYWLETTAYDHTYACNKIYRKELFYNIRFPKEMLFEDMYIMPRLIGLLPLTQGGNDFKKCKIRVTNLGMYYYNFNPKGITSTANVQALYQQWDNIQDTLPYVDTEQSGKKYSKELRLLRSRLLNMQITMCEQTGSTLDKGFLWTQICHHRFTTKDSLKALFIIIFGSKRLCKISNLSHKS